MKTIFTIIILSLFVQSCSDFSEVDLPKDQITRDLVFKDEALAKSAMAAVYRSLEESGFLSGSSSGAQSYLSCYVDELTSYATSGSDTSQFFTLTHNQTTGTVLNLWTVSYKQIYYINSVIEGLEKSDLSADFKEKLTAEALFLRGLIHLYLTETFGDVPYIKTTSYTVNMKVHRDPQNTVYGMISEDLLASLRGLPDTLTKGARVKPTKVAAYAVLSRLAYYQSRWDDAVFYSSKVLSDPGYGMETSIDKTFLKDSSSAIFQLMPYNNTYNTNEGNFFILRTAPPARVALAAEFVAGFEAGDLRRSQWVGEIKDSQNNSYNYPFKYKQFNITSATLEYSVILRVEEQYLIRAEAYTRNNQVALAKDDLNKLRARVNLQPLSPNSSAEMIDAVMKERKYELFTEFGHRFYDLKHHNQLDSVMSAVKSSWKSYFQLLPIPEAELLLNPNLNPQNNGY